MATHGGIEDRRAMVAQLVLREGFVSLVDLSGELGASESTIRRDLEILQQQGILARTHGGAVSTKYRFSERQTAMAKEKRAIARAAARLIRDGQTLLMWGGTTCYCIAEEIKGRPLSVVTNSVHVAGLLSADLETEVTLVGGYLYPRTGVALGPTAEQQLADLRASTFVTSCSGFGPGGVFNTNQMIVNTQRKMMAAADSIVLAADHSKFSQPGPAKQSELDELDVIVTDSGLDADARQWLETVKAKVIIAELT